MMYYIQYYLSLCIARICYPRVITKTVETEKIIKDPNGFMPNDMKAVRQLMKSKPYKLGDSLESVAYKQGQEDLCTLIETHIIGRG